MSDVAPKPPPPPAFTRMVLRNLRRLSAEQLAEIGTAIVLNDIFALDKIRRDRRSSALQVWIASVVKAGIQNGDAKALDIILTRLVGRPKEHIELSGPEGGPVVMSTMTPEQRITEIERLRAIRLAAGDD